MQKPFSMGAPTVSVCTILFLCIAAEAPNATSRQNVFTLIRQSCSRRTEKICCVSKHISFQNNVLHFNRPSQPSSSCGSLKSIYLKYKKKRREKKTRRNMYKNEQRYDVYRNGTGSAACVSYAYTMNY